MAGEEIFVSYKRERWKAAEHLAKVLRLYGFAVWFDFQLVKGSDFGLQIDRKIREAKAVVVLWCTMSAGSRWVAEEADLALNLGILVPARIEPCELRAGFRLLDDIDLSPWDGSPRSHQLDPLIEALESRIGRAAQLDLKGVREYEANWRLFGAPTLRQFVLGERAAEDGPHLPPGGTASGAAASPPPAAPAAGNGNGHDTRAIAAREEWPAVRDSGDTQRIESFRRYFEGTWQAEEARLMLDKIAAEAKHKREAERERQAEAWRRRGAAEQRLRAEGRIQVLIGKWDDETRWLKPGGGEPFCDVDGGPEMVVVPAGKFMMGSPDNEPERYANESPRHEVTFARPFAVARHAVTRGQFAAFVKATGHKADERWRHPGFAQDDSHPVVRISWDDAKAYAAWLETIYGHPYRLLSEAEWEYAARAGTVTPFWWGSSITPSQANYNGEHVYAGGGSKGEYRKGTVPVGSFNANPWGLYNVHGNVWEWMEDFWHDNYNGAPADGSAWITSPSGRGRVVRGGSWYLYPGVLRAALRYRYSAELSLSGFRLARMLTA
jgi:formylglycine-generating enzyme required for sulfatase activity